MYREREGECFEIEGVCREIESVYKGSVCLRQSVQRERERDRERDREMGKCAQDRGKECVLK